MSETKKPQMSRGKGSRGAYKEEKKEPFLEAFREEGTIQGAANTVEIERKSVYRWAETDPEFKKKFELLKASVRPDLIDRLETTGLAKAWAGDAQLIKFFLQSWARETYGDKFLVEIEYRLTANLVTTTLEVMRRNIPDHCPNCAHELGIKEAVTADMQKAIHKDGKNGA